MKNVIILGAGLSGISTAYFLQNASWVKSITLLEKEPTAGGLCRSVRKGNYVYDIGPHILFSKDKEMLQLMLDVLDEKNDLKRSNQILYKGCHIQYPFENDLSKLPQEELRYCIQSFNHNPYEDYPAENMIQFFLKTFGEGITNTYLRPYNEKIWKYDPAFMDTSMVDRIPKPTQEEIRRSAAGETVDGYLHQLHFHYPSQGGIEAVVNGLRARLDTNKCRIFTDSSVTKVEKEGLEYRVKTNGGQTYISDLVISTIPVQALTQAYSAVPDDIRSRVGELCYNSIAIAFLKTPYDRCGEHFTFTIPDKDVIFHRISKMDFLGAAYHHGDEATYMAEVTYHKNDAVDSMSDAELEAQLRQGMCSTGFADYFEDVELIDLIRQEYAYVIYDLKHKENMTEIRKFYQNQGLFLNGRFGNFEYWNMDRVLRESYSLTENLKTTKGNNT